MVALVRDRAAAGEPCGICGMPIDVTLPQWIIDADGKRKRSPLSVECDEIIPISRGGSPTDPDNVRPAHRICNQRRGAGGKEAKPLTFAHDTASGTGASKW